MTSETQQHPHHQQQPSQSRPTGQAMKAFLSGLKSTNSQEQYPLQIKPFFDFIDSLTSLSSVEEKADVFVNKARENSQWGRDSIISFIEHYKQRVNVDKTLTAGTLQHYYHLIKTFCEMNDLDTIV